jgi:hypothetical protein
MERDQESSTENELNNLGNIPTSISNRLQIIYFINRIRTSRNMQTSENSEELTSFERRARRRRSNFLDDWDSDAESMIDNLEIQEEHFDFRIYPLSINWNDIYSLDNDLCKYYF